MFLCGARGSPERLRSKKAQALVCGGSVERVVDEALVPFSVDVGNSEDDALHWRQLFFVVFVVFCVILQS